MGADITQLHRAVGQLRQCVGSLRAHYGDSAEVRRLVNDLDRLDIDVAEVTGVQSRPDAASPTPPTPRHERVVISDTPYDPELWEGADDEGVGGYRQDG